jgi:hypothetical protein
MLNIISNSDALAVDKEVFVRSLRSPAFFSVLMIGGKFVFPKKIFAARLGERSFECVWFFQSDKSNR